jgi:DNA-directed RNA polymerase subunit RPC12/RpoP
MFEKKYKCLKCKSVFGAWGIKPGKYGGYVDCCPTCGNTEMLSVKKYLGFGLSKLRVGMVGVVFYAIGIVLCLYVANAYFGITFISLGMITSIAAILIKSE